MPSRLVSCTAHRRFADAVSIAHTVDTHTSWVHQRVQIARQPEVFSMCSSKSTMQVTHLVPRPVSMSVCDASDTPEMMLGHCHKISSKIYTGMPPSCRHAGCTDKHSTALSPAVHFKCTPEGFKHTAVPPC